MKSIASMKGYLFGCLVAAMLVSTAAQAQTLKVLTVGAFRPVLDALAPTLDTSGQIHLQIVSDTAEALARRVENGEPFDVLIATPEVLSSVASEGRLYPKSTIQIAKAGIGVSAPANGAVPDISSVGALTEALLQAKSVAFIDPRSNDANGMTVIRVFDRLGITENMLRKAVPVQGGHVSEQVASGRAQLGLQQASEILAVPGVRLVGVLPESMQYYTTYAGAVSAASANPQAAIALVRYLVNRDAGAVMSQKGLIPLH